MDRQQVEEGLGKLKENRAASGEALDERLNQIEQFLKELPKAKPKGA